MKTTLISVLLNEHTRTLGGRTHMDRRKDPTYVLELDHDTGMVHIKHPHFGWQILHISSCMVTVDPTVAEKRPRGRPRKSPAAPPRIEA